MKDVIRELALCLDWIVRLPLVGDTELARLLGVAEHTARRLASDLMRLGWIESVEPTSQELEPRRRYIVRMQAVRSLTNATGQAKLERVLPIRLSDVLQRVTRFEATVGVNRLLADLAEHARQTSEGHLVDAASLPLGLGSRSSWWPVGASAFGCLQAGDSWAPFLIVWDRAAAPDEHRRSRVAAWSRARATIDQRWGADGLPAILIVCPGERQRAVWEQAVRNQHELDPFSLPSVLMTTREDLRAGGVGSDIWRRATDDASTRLINAVGWGATQPFSTPWVSDEPERWSRIECERGESIRAWALREIFSRKDEPIWRQIGALAVVLGRAERAVLAWLGRFPLLSAVEIAAFTNESTALVERRLEWVVRCGVARAVPPLTDDLIDERSPGMRDDDARYVLTGKGKRFLAERAGVTVAVMEESGGLRPKKRWTGDDQYGVRHVPHTIGTNRFLAQLAAAARERGGLLVQVRNDAESAREFTDEHGRAAVRPDASGIVEVTGTRFAFVLEYDRGTLDGGDFRGKFEAYRRYYQTESWRADFAVQPHLLFVCVDGRAERRILDAARLGGTGLPLFAITEERCQRRGPFAADWQTQHVARRGLVNEPDAPSVQGGRHAG